MKKAEITKILPILALAFTIFLLPSVTLALNTEQNVTVTVTNTAPSIGSITCTQALGGVDFPFTPTAGANFTVMCQATITDANGWQDINQSSFKAAFTPGGLAAENNSDDLNSHYTNGTNSNAGTDCAWSGSGGTDIVVTCGFYVMSYVDSANWTAIFRVTDKIITGSGAAVQNANTLSGNEIASVLGMDSVGGAAAALVGFGSQPLGSVLENGTANIQIFNVANRDMDISIREGSGRTFGGVVDGNAGNLTCAVFYSNNISTSGVANEGLRYNKTGGSSFVQGVNVTGVTTTYEDFSLAYTNASGTTHALAVNPFNVMLQIPSSGVRGLCAGTLELAAVNNV